MILVSRRRQPRASTSSKTSHSFRWPEARAYGSLHIVNALSAASTSLNSVRSKLCISPSTSRYPFIDHAADSDGYERKICRCDHCEYGTRETFARFSTANEKPSDIEDADAEQSNQGDDKTKKPNLWIASFRNRPNHKRHCWDAQRDPNQMH